MTTATLLRRFAVTSAAVSVLAAGVVAPASAAPERLSAAALSFPTSALPGWIISPAAAPGGVGIARAPFATPGTWASQISIGDFGRAGLDVRALAKALAGEIAKDGGYQGHNPRIEGLQVTDTRVSGVVAARATANIVLQNAPTRGERLRITVVDTNPETYFVSQVPFEAADRQAQATAAESRLVVTR
ncbi:hypothetical protein [Tsukamurella ocularis]|uniref:hypothetical protein n=1 Tax=Tsukamurella ocularis TaxID=1970234 RepID=UPI0021694BCF|nr:hypothetical protein [Tsukamurella ocularis]MCS3779871.1 hypothetical protein [Tsukamurella ocularis]MCS3788729.1 hypothetical protein [Tsukamurella ocularis]MCS3849939.1 hypothetical protein [Tsukamurella ocularis]